MKYHIMIRYFYYYLYLCRFFFQTWEMHYKWWIPIYIHIIFASNFEVVRFHVTRKIRRWNNFYQIPQKVMSFWIGCLKKVKSKSHKSKVLFIFAFFLKKNWKVILKKMSSHLWLFSRIVNTFDDCMPKNQ